MSRLALEALLALAVVGAAWLGPVKTAEAEKRGGTLTIVRPTDPVSLDPNLETTAPGAWVYFNMLEGLLTLDDKVQVKPALATGYEVLSPTRVRFKLRPNVKFHDGTPFNAAAVLKNILPTVAVYSTLLMANAILVEAALSFLGLGVQPATPSWGLMVSTGRDLLLVAPHVATIPGLAIMVAVLGFNLLGDGLRDALDPRLRGQV